MNKEKENLDQIVVVGLQDVVGGGKRGDLLIPQHHARHKLHVTDAVDPTDTALAARAVGSNLAHTDEEKLDTSRLEQVGVVARGTDIAAVSGADGQSSRRTDAILVAVEVAGTRVHRRKSIRKQDDEIRLHVTDHALRTVLLGNALGAGAHTRSVLAPR